MDLDDEIVEEDFEIYFCYKATLRICGKDLDFQNITNILGIEPTHAHKVGDYRKWKGKKVGKPLDEDMWSYTAQIPENNKLDEHIQHLWTIFKPHKESLLHLKEIYSVDIFCGYRSNCDHAGFEVLSESLEIFSELKIPFAVSVIIA